LRCNQAQSVANAHEAGVERRRSRVVSAARRFVRQRQPERGWHREIAHVINGMNLDVTT
jgi:hypothetical protein